MEAADVMNEIVTVEGQARALKVVDAPSYTMAGELWKAIRGIRATVAKTFDGNIKKAHELHKGLVAEKKRHDAPLDEAERIVKMAMSVYDQEQARIAQEEARRLEEIARKAEEERLLQEAILAEEAGEKEEAAAIIEEPVYVPPITIAKATPKLEGGPTFRTIMKFQIIDEKLIPREYLTPDTTKIGGVVRAMKMTANIPGVRIYEERC